MLNELAVDLAIKSENTELLDVLVKDSPKSLSRDTLLKRTIIASPSTEIIQHVLDYGYDINYKDEDGNTILHFAAMSFYPETVRFFISKGLDLEAVNKMGETPLFVAAKKNGNLEIIEIFIEAGANVKTTCNGGANLLIIAAGFNPNPQIVKYLLKKGFDIEACDDDGLTALLSAAAWQRNSDVLDVLIEAGANIGAKTKNGENLFHLAACNKSCDVVRYVSLAFSTSDTNDDGSTCLERALQFGESSEVLNIYLRKMKEEHVMLACFNENPEILEALILAGYDPNTIDSYGMSAMMMAAKVNSNPDVIEMLVYYHAVWDNHDDEGRNVLHYAASNSDPEIYNWMMKDDAFSKFSSEKDIKGNVPEYYRTHPEDF